MSKQINYSYVGITFIILIFGIIFIPKIIKRVSEKDISRANESRKNSIVNKNQKKTSSLTYLTDAMGGRRKVPSFSFTNQDGKIITNKDFLEKVYVVEFFFTSCPTICPKMNNNLVQIQNHFLTFQENFGVASITINPEKDTPEVLKAYANNYGITNPNWHLLTGNKDSIYKLANDGFYLYATEDQNIEGGFEHSGNFALIDKKGYIRSRILNSGNPLIYYNGVISETQGIDDNGIPQEITMLKEDIAKLLEE